LGTESAVATPARQRFLWDRIAERLNQLASRISPEDRRSIEAALIEKIESGNGWSGMERSPPQSKWGSRNEETHNSPRFACFPRSESF
jgi:hypothetical protein